MISLEKYLKDGAKNLTLLIVEDDMITMESMVSILSPFFQHIYKAYDGEEGLSQYKLLQPDIIIADNLMPNMSGIEMIKKIKDINPSIPSIFVTAYVEPDYLTQLINIKITYLVNKPITKKELYQAIKQSLEQIASQAFLKDNSINELEILRLREKKHHVEQERAFKKELNIIRNDLYYKYITTPQHEICLIDIFYKPLETLSGDSYSLRALGEGKIFFFILDAMGKGVSASITSMLSASFINYTVDSMIEDKRFDLEILLREYFHFINKELLDDEMVASMFVCIDQNTNIMQLASYSMPPILAVTKDKELVKIKSNNIPIMKFGMSYNIKDINIETYEKILFYSDGLNEAEMNEDEDYSKRLETDFLTSFSKNNFMEKVKDNIEHIKDDIAMFHFQKIHQQPKTVKTFMIKSKIAEIDKAFVQISTFLSTLNVSEEFEIQYHNSFTEMVMNDYEHGNFSLTYQQKHELMLNDTYEDFLTQKELELGEVKQIEITLSYYENENNRYILTQISDSGEGFDTLILRNKLLGNDRFHGRGITMTKNYVDGLYYSDKANSVLMTKQIH